MFAVRNFCKKRKITRKIEDAFIAYCKASISDYYQIKSGETITGLLTKFTEEEVEQLWQKFVVDLRRTLSQENVT